ncbi:hypothetical protein BYT27DRAFT_7084937, partial [Phlegmacium glaucopus]
VYRFQKGRVLDNGDKPVKDVMDTGLEALSYGTKNPLSEYNSAFQRLQMRRPVSSDISGSVDNNRTTAGMTVDPDARTETLLPSVIPSESVPTTLIQEDQPGLLVVESEDEDNQEEAGISELEEVLREIEQGGDGGDELLPRLSEDDVALDMDEVLIEYDDREPDDTSSDEFDSEDNLD